MPDATDPLRAPADRFPSPDQNVPTTPREIELGAITQGAREVVILHNGSRYRLRVTANDKLILTK